MKKAFNFNPPTRTYLGGPKAMDTPMDIKELPSGIIVLTVDMPGVNPNEINVQVEDGTVLRKFPRFNLVISGERKRTEEDKEGKYLMRERTMGKFARKFQLPESANMETIAALYRDGVLTVTVEKKPSPAEPKKPRTVEVKVDYFRG